MEKKIFILQDGPCEGRRIWTYLINGEEPKHIRVLIGSDNAQLVDAQGFGASRAYLPQEVLTYYRKPVDDGYGYFYMNTKKKGG